MAKKNGTREEDNWDDLEDEDEGSEEETDEAEGEEDEPEEEEVEDDGVETDVDPEDEDVVKIKEYTVQTDHEDGDDIIEAGTKIPVKCANCALWERPVAAKKDKPLCFPGRQVRLEVGGKERSWRMSEDRFSCQEAFVPKEIGSLADFLVNDYDEVLMLKWIAPAARQLIKMRKRILKRCEKVGHPKPDEIMSRMEQAALLLQSEEQIDYVMPMIDHVAELLKAKRRKKEKKEKISTGAEVSWLDAGTGKRVHGTVIKYALRANQIKFIVSGEPVATLMPEEAKRWLGENPGKNLAGLACHYTMELSTWRQREPKVEREVVVIDTDEE